MQRFQKHFGWAVIASELSHIFCCVLPTVVTILSASANLGLFVLSPDGFLMDIHDHLHDYEIPIIAFSGVMVAFGWIAHKAAQKVDCHDTGCVHPPCTPQKTMNAKILTVATILFVLNVIIYFGVHRNMLGLEIFSAKTAIEEHHEHEHSHGHGHGHDHD